MRRDRSRTWLLREPHAGDFGEVYLALLEGEIAAGRGDAPAPFLPCALTRRGLLAALGGDFETHARDLDQEHLDPSPDDDALDDAYERSAAWSGRLGAALFERHAGDPERAADAGRVAHAFLHAALQRRAGALARGGEGERVRTLARKLGDVEDENARLTTAARERLELLARMSHDLRTPLNAILGFTDMLRRDEAGPLNAEQRDFVEDIHASGQQLYRTLGDVLDLARLESGGLELRPAPASIAAVLASVCEKLADGIRARKISVRTRVEVGLDVVHVDPERLTQIVQAFASNAVRHGLEGSAVEIEARREGASAFRVEISDRSPGIERELRERLFQRGMPGRRRGRAGLGLALAKRLAEAMGGTVGVTSTLGEGSCFFVVLPLRSGRTPLPSPWELAGRTPGAPRVLVVDDDARDQRRIAEALVRAGLAVDCVASGTQAIDALARRAYDAVTLDLLLPDTNGLSVLAALRRARKTRKLPVVIVSVTTERASGGFVVADVIEKPAAPHELVEALARAGVRGSPSAPVLVVDDDERSSRLAASALTKAGFEVDLAENGAVGLARADASPPAAVVLDLEMPVLDGFGFLDRFRADPRFAQVPVLVWTVHDLGPYEVRELARRAEVVLPKDGTGAGQLVSTLRSELGRRHEG